MSEQKTESRCPLLPGDEVVVNGVRGRVDTVVRIEEEMPSGRERTSWKVHYTTHDGRPGQVTKTETYLAAIRAYAMATNGVPVVET